MAGVGKEQPMEPIDDAAKEENAKPIERESNEVKTENVEPKDVEAKDAEPKDAEAKDAEPKDTESKDAESKDTEAKNAEPKDAKVKNAEPKDAEAEDAEPKDTEAKDAEPKDAEAEDAEPKDTEGKDAEPKEAEDADPQDAEPKDDNTESEAIDLEQIQLEDDCGEGLSPDVPKKRMSSQLPELYEAVTKVWTELKLRVDGIIRKCQDNDDAYAAEAKDHIRLTDDGTRNYVIELLLVLHVLKCQMRRVIDELSTSYRYRTSPMLRTWIEVHKLLTRQDWTGLDADDLTPHSLDEIGTKRILQEKLEELTTMLKSLQGCKNKPFCSEAWKEFRTLWTGIIHDAIKEDSVENILKSTEKVATNLKAMKEKFDEVLKDNKVIPQPEVF